MSGSSHTVVIPSKQLSFEAHEEEDLITAAARSGIRITKACRNGICEVCKGQLLAGCVTTAKGVFYAGDEQVKPLLPCVTKASSDLILELNKVLGPGEIPLQHIAFQIADVTCLSDGATGQIYRINLLSPAGKLPQYHAGQYLELLIDDNAFPFTIASAPDGRNIELHLGVTPDNESATLVLKHLQNEPTVRVRLPNGNVWTTAELHPNNLHDPLVFVVAGTGFAQAKAMIEEQLRHQHPALFLYWVNKDCDGFYTDLPEQWAAKGLINYKAICSENTACQQHEFRPVEDCIAEQITHISNIRVVACGGPSFVYSVLDGLESKGLHESQMASDVFAYAPRPTGASEA